MQRKLTPLVIAQSIYVINRRVKQVPDPDLLYKLKHEAIAKLLKENKAEKLYLHRFNRVQKLHALLTTPTKIDKIFVVVKCENYHFHYPANQMDLKELKFQNKIYDSPNPPSDISYFAAKKNILNYLESYTPSNR